MTTTTPQSEEELGKILNTYWVERNEARPSGVKASRSHKKAKQAILALKQQWELESLNAISKAGRNWQEPNEGTRYELEKRIAELSTLKNGEKT
jgi:hypothetical protein